MTITQTTYGGKVLLNFQGEQLNSFGVFEVLYFAIFRDGVQLNPGNDLVIQAFNYSYSGSNYAEPFPIPSLVFVDTGVPAGSHTWEVRWHTGSGNNVQMGGSARFFQATELS